MSELKQDEVQNENDSKTKNKINLCIIKNLKVNYLPHDINFKLVSVKLVGTTDG